MTFLTALWLPILVSAVFVFIVSSIIHMATPMHKGDMRKVKNEDAILEALRSQGLEPGEYMFPCPGSMKEMGSPEMMEKFKRGPVGRLIIMPAGGCNIGQSLMQWFLHTLLIGMLVAYVSWHALGAGAHYLSVFRVAGTAALLGYAAGYVVDSIWKGVSWGTSARFIFDGVVYALVTAGTFGWLWPDAA